jgi:hypothetical protein
MIEYFFYKARFARTRLKIAEIESGSFKVDTAGCDTANLISRYPRNTTANFD